MHEDFLAGFVQFERTEGRLQFGRVDFADAIQRSVGWRATAIANAFAALEAYINVRDKEGEGSTSRKYRAALERLSDGKISHYLFQSNEWYLLDESRTLRGIRLRWYRDGHIAWAWRKGTTLKPRFITAKPQFAAFRNLPSHRLVLRDTGRHWFGGPPRHTGVFPEGSTVPLHHFLTIDLADLRSPFNYELKSTRYLSLYYPLAYGSGGAAIQYAIRSNERIEILHLSDPVPDRETPYVLEPILPPSRADIVPLTYEELRMRIFLRDLECPGLNPADRKLWNKLGGNHQVKFGGKAPANTGKMICRNPGCKSFKSRIELELIVSIPPIPIGEQTAFWHEFEGVSLEFCFGLCPDCRTIIAFNVSD